MSKTTETVRTLQELVNDQDAEAASAITAAYWSGLSDGQEHAESKIRRRLDTLPLGRYWRVTMSAIDYLLTDNRHAKIAPVCPAGPEIRSWEFDA